MWIRLQGKAPLHRQIYHQLRAAILDGTRAPGARLPASRRLARALGVSRNVVVLAYEQLLAEGYVVGRTGAGTFVAAPLPTVPPPAAVDRAPAPASPPRLAAFARRALAERPYTQAVHAEPARRLRYDFRYVGVELDRRGLAVWRTLIARHAGRATLDYAPTAGVPALRAAIADYVRRNRGVRCAAEQVLVTSGSQQALDLVVRVLLDPGARVAIEDPCYQGARQAFRAGGAELAPVAVDDDGLDVERLARVGGGARLVYVTPSHQFPTGAVLPLPRRLALLEWAAGHDAYIVEDDYDSEFRYRGRPVEAVQGLDRHARTIYVGTLSKILSPALRLGYLILPPPLVEPFTAVKWLLDRHTAALEQAALADFMAEGHFARHLRRMRTRSAERRAALLEALERQLGARARITGTNAGVHLLLWLDGVAPEDLEGLIARAAARGVGVYPCRPYFVAPPPAAGLLLGYAALPAADIARGIAILGDAIGDVAA